MVHRLHSTGIRVARASNGLLRLALDRARPRNGQTSAYNAAKINRLTSSAVLGPRNFSSSPHHHHPTPTPPESDSPPDPKLEPSWRRWETLMHYVVVAVLGSLTGYFAEPIFGISLFVSSTSLFCFDPFWDWPIELRDGLRDGMKAKLRGDLEDSITFLTCAWETAKILPPEAFGSEASWRLTDIAIALADALEWADKPEEATVVLHDAIQLLPANVGTCKMRTLAIEIQLVKLSSSIDSPAKRHHRLTVIANNLPTNETSRQEFMPEHVEKLAEVPSETSEDWRWHGINLPGWANGRHGGTWLFLAEVAAQVQFDKGELAASLGLYKGFLKLEKNLFPDDKYHSRSWSPYLSDTWLRERLRRDSVKTACTDLRMDLMPFDDFAEEFPRFFKELDDDITLMNRVREILSFSSPDIEKRFENLIQQRFRLSVKHDMLKEKHKLTTTKGRPHVRNKVAAKPASEPGSTSIVGSTGSAINPPSSPKDAQ